MVRIPKEMVEHEDIKEGEMVEVEVHKAKKDLFGASPDMPPLTHGNKLDENEKASVELLKTLRGSIEFKSSDEKNALTKGAMPKRNQKRF